MFVEMLNSFAEDKKHSYHVHAFAFIVISRKPFCAFCYAHIDALGREPMQL